MTPELSRKIRIATFVATILVVFRHAANIQAFFPTRQVSHALLSFESGTVFLTDVAVPFFFFVSGFFFMRHSYYEKSSYWGMIQKKTKTLLLPYLTWNLVGAVVLCIYDKDDILGTSMSSCSHNLLMSYWYGPLWYVRDIMILMLLYPIYGWMYKKWGQVILCLCILYLMWFSWHPGWDNLLAGEGLVFFLWGGLIQQYKNILNKQIPTWLSLMALLFWIVMSFTYTSWDWNIHRISILIAIPTFWISLDLIQGRMKEWCLRLAPYSFLIYVTHFYFQKTIKHIFAYFFPENAWVALFAFFFVPVVCVATAIVVGRYWKRWFPKSYSICVGGR